MTENIGKISIFTKDKEYRFDEELKGRKVEIIDRDNYSAIKIDPFLFPPEDVKWWPIVVSNQDGEIILDGEIKKYRELESRTGNYAKYYCIPPRK